MCRSCRLLPVFLCASKIKAMKLKSCMGCGQQKPLSEFNTERKGRDGKRSRCKLCIYEREKRYRNTKQGRAKIRLYERSKKHKDARVAYFKTTSGKLARTKSYKRYAKTAKAKAARLRWKTRHPERVKAKTSVATEVRSGRIPHPSSFLCFYCRGDATEYHHYLGYRLEHHLDVVAVCHQCNMTQG